MGIDCALLRDVPPAEYHHSDDRGGLPLPRRRGLPLAGPAQGLPALADGALVVGPLPPRGRVGPRHPRADARGAHRRRPGRRAPDRPRRQPERALRPPEGGAWLGRRQEDQRSQAPRPDVLRRLPPHRHGDRRQRARQARPRSAARARPRVRLAPAAAGRRRQLRRRGRRRRCRPARRDPHRRLAPAGARGLRPDPAPLARRAGLGHPDDPQQAPRRRLGAAAGSLRDDDARRQPPSPHPCCRSGMLKSNRVLDKAALPPEICPRAFVTPTYALISAAYLICLLALVITVMHCNALLAQALHLRLVIWIFATLRLPYGLATALVHAFLKRGLLRVLGRDEIVCPCSH